MNVVVSSDCSVHLEKARGERCVLVSLFIGLAIACMCVPCLLVHIFPDLLEDRYAELMMVVAEMAREVKPAYTGNKGSAEKLKKSELFMQAHYWCFFICVTNRSML